MGKLVLHPSYPLVRTRSVGTHLTTNKTTTYQLPSNHHHQPKQHHRPPKRPPNPNVDRAERRLNRIQSELVDRDRWVRRVVLVLRRVRSIRPSHRSHQLCLRNRMHRSRSRSRSRNPNRNPNPNHNLTRCTPSLRWARDRTRVTTPCYQAHHHHPRDPCTPCPGEECQVGLLL